MKTFTKKILAVIVLLVLSISLLPMSAMAYEPGDFDYELDDNGNATITYYDGPGGEVTIPAKLDDHPVTAIGSGVFYNNDSITSLTFKGDISSIDYHGGGGTFQYCDSLKYVTFEGNVGTIGEYAFYDCGLTTVTFQGDVGTIGEEAFQYCKGLTTVTFQGDVGTIGEKAFYSCGLTTVTFQGDVGTIGEAAFYHCIALKDIYFNGTEAEWNAVTKGEYWNYACPDDMEIHFSEYAVEVSASPAEGGSVTGGATYDTGKPATVTATPNEGYDFVNWTEGGTEVSTGTSYSFMVEKKRSLVANFAAKKYDLTFDLNGGTLNGQTGTITMTCEYGSKINLPDAPTKEGYTFKYWKGSEYAAGAEYTVTEKHVFTAEWEEVKKEQDASPKTGDHNDAGLWAAVLGGSLLAVILLITAGRKYLKKHR